MNYHSSKGELLTLDYGLKKFSRFLHQGPFTVRSDNATVIHWETMNADENVAPCVKRWLENFSLFNMKLVHMPGKEIPADPLSRLTNLPSAVGSELNSSVDFEPRYPLPHPLDKINKILFIEREGSRASLLRDNSEYAERVRINDKLHNLRNYRIIHPPTATYLVRPRHRGQMHF